MGIDLRVAHFLQGEAKRGIKFANTITLGRQAIYMNPLEYSNILKNLRVNNHKKLIYADEFLKSLGVDSLDIMDASDYEGATVLHDLNQNLPKDFIKRYDCLVDGGTLEHVFNFPEAIKTCMELVKLGGSLILITPWHNYAGHGFYQFSPELFYRILAPDNGYCVERMLIIQKGKWHSIQDPELINMRIENNSGEKTLLYISAKRIELKTIFNKWPQQSDYSTAWAHDDKKECSKDSQILKNVIIKGIPILYKIQKMWRETKQLHYYAKRKAKWCFPLDDDKGIPL
jgi:hypothetical protein